MGMSLDDVFDGSRYREEFIERNIRAQKKSASKLMALGAAYGLAECANTVRIYREIQATGNTEYGGGLAVHCIATSGLLLPLLAGTLLWYRTRRWYERMNRE